MVLGRSCDQVLSILLVPEASRAAVGQAPKAIADGIGESSLDSLRPKNRDSSGDSRFHARQYLARSCAVVDV